MWFTLLKNLLSCRAFPKKKKHGKVPKKIHKSEREKLKRDYLNELFLELGNALEPTRQNNGKASILGDATRLLRELLSQVNCLKRENVALVSESNYVTIEKNELTDENAALESQIEELHTQLKEGAPNQPTWNSVPVQSQNNNLPSSLLEDPLKLPVADPALQVRPVVGPVLVIPLHHDFQAFPEPGSAPVPSTIPSNVRRPQARYPTPSDSWPSQLLGEQSNLTKTNQSGSDDAGHRKE
ncbi:hypothetical protein IFM89_028361 [Coptis chinensis]|uniref:BHLH domain-containing protein n=1 Tax=Coptis chinensis TaxID=261450 RepID=A0A835MB18_9MAGN|nr:hypothetical protein IFM89_028361 [Coptis chinensis]